jgi:hypothetical protein
MTKEVNGAVIGGPIISFQTKSKVLHSQHYKSKGMADSFLHPKTLNMISHPKSDC